MGPPPGWFPLLTTYNHPTARRRFASPLFWVRTAPANPIFPTECTAFCAHGMRISVQPARFNVGVGRTAEQVMRFPAKILSGALGTLLTMAGCAGPVEPAWTAPPQVRWPDICIEAFPRTINGYRMLAPAGSTGRFPTVVAVSRVSMAVETVDRHRRQARRSYLSAKPKNEFLGWNNAFDDQMAISEVFPVAQRDLGGWPAEPLQIIASFKALGAGLGLIYAQNELTPDRTEMIGILYEAETATPIAAIHAWAVSITPPEDECKKPLDLWRYDSTALVRQKFEGLVYACMRELILNDQPQRVDAPTGWTPAGPIRPVEWPPRQFRTLP